MKQGSGVMGYRRAEYDVTNQIDTTDASAAPLPRCFTTSAICGALAILKNAMVPNTR